VNEFHRLSRVVGTNRNGRQIELAEFSTDLFENIRVGSVAPEPEFASLKILS
jgi:hypothetical protein